MVHVEKCPFETIPTLQQFYHDFSGHGTGIRWLRLTRRSTQSEEHFLKFLASWHVEKYVIFKYFAERGQLLLNALYGSEYQRIVFTRGVTLSVVMYTFD